MSIQVYRAQEFETTHERQAIDDFIDKLAQEYPHDGETVIVLENYICNSNQIDATVLKKDGIIVIEFKNYGGEIIFSENGDWTANGTAIKGGRDNRNPCQQVRAYKYSLLNFLRDHADKILTQSREIEWGHVSGMVIFHQPIRFDKNMVPQPMRPWFHVTDIEESAITIKAITSSKLFLSDEELQRIPILLGLKPIGKDMPVEAEIGFVLTHNAQLPIEIPTIIPKATAKRKPRQSYMERILDYYLRCLELEDIKRSELRDKPESVMWLPSEAPNLLEDRSKSIIIDQKHDFFKSIKNNEKRERPRSIFFGFPVIKVSQNSGKIMPCFFCQLYYEESEKGLILKRIPEEDYVINKVLFRLAGINTPEESEAASAEILELPTLEKRIEFLRSKYNLAIPADNLAIIYIAESSDVTHNLVEELGQLIAPSNLKLLESTPAKYLISSDYIIEEKGNTSIESLLEVFPMNNTQRTSVMRAFNEQITVVTGPPGNGKSQVVLNILANAIIQEKTVLFASKINTALDVVNDRFRKYVVDEDLIVRIGNKKQMQTIFEDLKGLFYRISNGQIKIDEQEVKEAKTQLSNAENMIKEGMALLEELRVLPTRIAEEENLYSATVQNHNDEMAKLAKEKEQLENRIKGLLKPIPAKVLQTIYSDRKRPVCRKRDIEKLRLRAHRLLTKDGLKIYGRIGRWLMSSFCIAKLKKALIVQENNIPTELLNWMDNVSPITSTFEGLLKRAETILQLLAWDEDIQSARDIETSIEALEKKCTSIRQEFSALEEKLRSQITASRERYKQLKRDEEEIRNRIEKAQQEKIILARKFINVLWKHKISNREALESIVKLLLYFIKSSYIAASTDPVPNAIKYLPIWSVSSLSARNGLPLRPGIFDLLVIDEAAQCDIPSAIPLFFRCKKVIVIGDPMQLKHISSVSEKEDNLLAKDAGCEDFPCRYSRYSLFDRMEYVAKNSGKIVEFLEEHFRCQEKIIQFSNIHIYLPRTGRELVVKTPPLTSDSQPTLTWVNVRGRIPSNSKRNPSEVKIILETLKTLVPLAKNANYQIGVTTPFRDQADELIQNIPSEYNHIVTADTVHKFQGNEKDIIMFSPVIAEGATKSMINFINTGAPQLLNVAVTRARSRLIVVGDFDACLEAGGLLKQLALYMRKNGELIR